MGLRTAEFSKQLNRLTRVAIDRVVLIYHLEDVTPYSELTEVLFARIAAGSLEAVFSTIMTELFVKPIAADDEGAIQAFLKLFCIHFHHRDGWRQTMPWPGKQPASEPNTNCEPLTLCCSPLR